MSEKNVPVIHLHCFGELDLAQATGAHLLDWSDSFDRGVTPRRIPGPARWEQRLWPELRGVADEIGPAGLIRVQGNAALSAGFALGCTFPRVSRRHLEVAQWPPDGAVWWASKEPGPPEAKFTTWELPGQPQADEGVVIVKALPDRGETSVVADVDTFLDEKGVFKQIKLPQYNVPAIGNLLSVGFSQEDLQEFCFYSLLLKPLYERIRDNTRQKEMIRLVIEYAERRGEMEALLSEVAQKIPQRYLEHQDHLRTPIAQSRQFKAALLLEAGQVAATDGKLSAGEAAAMARHSQAQLRAFTSRYGINKLRLFLAAPLGLAVFLGHQWNAIGCMAQCYEWAGVSGQYLPSCEVELN